MFTAGGAGSGLQAQVFFSADPQYLQVKREGNNLLNIYSPEYPDTSITDEHDFFPVNYLGNIGLASPSYFLSYGTSDLGFRFYGEPYENDRFFEHQVAYYRSKGPFASLRGIAGSRELQIFKALFTHTYQRKINITLGFERYTSKGFYRRQHTYTNKFYLSSNYQTASHRFGYYFFFLSNSNRHHENGGIRAGTLSDSTVGIDKELMPVNITAGSRDNSDNRVMFNPYFKLNRGHDSTHKYVSYLQLKSKYRGGLFMYNDNNMAADNYYRYVFLDQVQTRDSARLRQVSNDLLLSMQNEKQGHQIHAGYRNETSYIWQKIDSLLINHMATAEVQLTPVKGDSVRARLDLHGTAQFIFAGSNQGNYRVEANAVYSSPATGRRVFVDGLAELRTPDYIYNTWVSNHFVWMNRGLEPQQLFEFRAGWQPLRSLKATFLYQGIKNYLYFDEAALPAQFNGNVANLAVKFEFSKVLLRHLGVAVQYIYQNSSHPGIVRLPASFLRPALYYQAFLFRKNLQFQLGAEARLYESFVPYAYMPATQAFYLQDVFSTSQYPFVDVFFNARIRPVSIFFKMENILQGFAGNNYAFVPGYYQPDRALRFGLKWMFFD